MGINCFQMNKNDHESHGEDAAHINCCVNVTLGSKSSSEGFACDVFIIALSE